MAYPDKHPPAASMDSTAVVQASTGSHSRSIQAAAEGIFRDLLRGVRAEEVLGPRETLEEFVYKETATWEAPTKSAASRNIPLIKMSIDLVGGITKSELAESMLALKATYWLDHQASIDPRPSFYSTQLAGALSMDTNPVRSQKATVVPNVSIYGLLPIFKRYHGFSKTHGWKLLTLLSLSRTFRNAASEFTKVQWSLLLKLISENNASFELIIKTTRPKYGAILVAMFQDLGITESIADSPSGAWIAALNWTYAAAAAAAAHQPLELENLGDPMAVRYLNHPHRWFVTIDKSSVMPVTPVYIPIEHSVLHPEDFSERNDPRYIGADCERIDGFVYGKVVCDMCEAKGATECGVVFKSYFPEPLVEVIETDGKGLGVRSLQTISKGTIIGEYAGLIRENATKGDVYVLNGHLGYTDENFYLTTSLHQGNFTRFVNHSCSPNCFLTGRNFRGRKVSVLLAIKEIRLFEEVTTDYGQDYFVKRGMKCKCGAQGCKIG